MCEKVDRSRFMQFVLQSPNNHNKETDLFSIRSREKKMLFHFHGSIVVIFVDVVFLTFSLRVYFISRFRKVSNSQEQLQ